ncbi:unnamed protein product, partial [Musa textilis]
VFYFSDCKLCLCLQLLDSYISFSCDAQASKLTLPLVIVKIKWRIHIFQSNSFAQDSTI